MKIGILVRRGAMMQEPIVDAEWAKDAIERLGPTTPEALKILRGRHAGGPRTVATVAISFARSRRRGDRVRRRLPLLAHRVISLRCGILVAIGAWRTSSNQSRL